MAKAQKPLTILVHPSLMETPEIQDLINKGHTVDDMTYETLSLNPCDYDMILSPTAWRIIPSLTKHISEAVKAARAIKYIKKEV